jgi:hypothetical protein
MLSCAVLDGVQILEAQWFSEDGIGWREEIFRAQKLSLGL